LFTNKTCPICGNQGKSSCYSGPYGVEEEHYRCDRCDYSYNFNYGECEEIIKGEKFEYSHNAEEKDMRKRNEKLLKEKELYDSILKIFGCQIGDTLFVVDLKYKKVLKFEVDSLKIFNNNITAHGYLECAWASKVHPFNIPTEFSLKNLNTRVIFTEKKMANAWFNKMRKNKEEDI